MEIPDSKIIDLLVETATEMKSLGTQMSTYIEAHNQIHKDGQKKWADQKDLNKTFTDKFTKLERIYIVTMLLMAFVNIGAGIVVLIKFKDAIFGA